MLVSVRLCTWGVLAGVREKVFDSAPMPWPAGGGGGVGRGAATLLLTVSSEVTKREQTRAPVSTTVPRTATAMRTARTA